MVGGDKRIVHCVIKQHVFMPFNSCLHSGKASAAEPLPFFFAKRLRMVKPAAQYVRIQVKCMLEIKHKRIANQVDCAGGIFIERLRE